MKTLTGKVKVLAAIVALVIGLSCFGSTAEAAQPSKKRGDADGTNDRAEKARWEWKLLDEQGKSTKTGTFTGHRNGTITRGKNQKIGTFEYTRKKITVTFTDGPLQGEVKLVLSERKPVAYRGELIRSNGSKADVEVVIIND